MKLYQITEDDLCELEMVLPKLADAAMPHMNAAQRIKWRNVQAVLSRVRWNYGPARDVEKIPEGD